MVIFKIHRVIIHLITCKFWHSPTLLLLQIHFHVLITKDQNKGRKLKVAMQKGSMSKKYKMNVSCIQEHFHLESNNEFGTRMAGFTYFNR